MFSKKNVGDSGTITLNGTYTCDKNCNYDSLVPVFDKPVLIDGPVVFNMTQMGVKIKFNNTVNAKNGAGDSLQINGYVYQSPEGHQFLDGEVFFNQDVGNSKALDSVAVGCDQVTLKGNITTKSTIQLQNSVTLNASSTTLSTGGQITIGDVTNTAAVGAKPTLILKASTEIVFAGTIDNFSITCNSSKISISSPLQ